MRLGPKLSCFRAADHLLLRQPPLPGSALLCERCRLPSPASVSRPALICLRDLVSFSIAAERRVSEGHFGAPIPPFSLLPGFPAAEGISSSLPRKGQGFGNYSSLQRC